MSAIEDYKRNGGLQGFAHKTLLEQIEAAQKDPAHILGGVAAAMSEDQHDKASELLLAALQSLPQEHPLEAFRAVLMVFATQEWVAEVAKIIKEGGDAPEGTPQRITAWASMTALESHRNSISASHRRPKKNDSGDHFDDVIRALAKAQPQESKPSELWPHLKTAIEEWAGSDCTERNTQSKKRDEWRYCYTKADGDKDSYTYAAFRKKLKGIRNGK